MHWPDKIPFVPDAREHAMEIVEVFDGEWQMAAENYQVYAAMYGEDYAKRLMGCLIPKGEC